MTFSNQLFFAILSMDAYNRGGVAGIDRREIRRQQSNTSKKSVNNFE